MTQTLDITTAILKDLVAFPTVSADSNLDMMGYITDRLEAAGAKVDIQHDESGTKANLFATIGPEVDGGIVLSGHSDVVPTSDQVWATDPYELNERNGRLFGRGTCDMKGFVAASVAMAPQFAQATREIPLHIAVTYDEEVGCIGAGHLAKFLKQKGIRPRIAIVGEPTLMRLVDGHKGCFEYTTRFRGLEGHGSDPDRGVNAVEYASRYVARLLELRNELQTRTPADSNFAPPWTTLNVGAVHGGTVPNVIAPQAEIAWEMRPVQTSDAEFVKSRLSDFCNRELLPAMLAVTPDASIETEVIGEVIGLEPDTGNQAVRLVSKLTGANGTETVPFGTEAGIFQSLGMDVVVCGPGSIEQAHKADEFLEIDQLSACLTMLERLAARLSDGQAF